MIDYWKTGLYWMEQRGKKRGQQSIFLEEKREDYEEGGEEWDSLEINKEKNCIYL